MTATQDWTLRLTPSGVLQIDSISTSTFSKNFCESFTNDFREGWFRLGADKKYLSKDPVIIFWQEIASQFITAICHLPSDEELPHITPNADRFADWVLGSPPMKGGEYLTIDLLRTLWNQLRDWVCDRVAEKDGIQSFLAAWAPDFQQVGRVCFHLAENKKDPEKPFAFLATYSIGISAVGKAKHLPLREALQQSSRDQNHQSLIKLLKPVNLATLKCPWVKELVESFEIYQPLAWTAQKAYKFLCSIPELEACGIAVRIPNWWKKRTRAQVSVTIEASKQSGIGVASLLDFKVNVALGDEAITEEELKELLSRNERLTFLRGQWVEVDREKLNEVLEHWKMIQKGHKHGEISFIEGMRLLAGVSSAGQEGDYLKEKDQWVRIAPGEQLAQILLRLRDPSLIQCEQLDALTVSLRPYQLEGVRWLSLLTGLGMGACLADDMGLGKTLQILSLLLLFQKRNNHSASLLVVPASLLGNWKKEADKFTPSLRLLLLHPTERNEEEAKSLDTYDLVVTTYSMVSRYSFLAERQWNLLILDEAQAIKNSGTKQSKAVKGIRSSSRIALTGTPIENRLSDLWSLFDFLNPGLLGSAKGFKDYVNDLQKTSGQFASLRKLVNPYILRRMKTDPKVISDLPDKIETATYCRLTKQQASYYQTVVEELKETLKRVDPKARRGAILRALLQLKQICNHPIHFAGVGEYLPAHSGKFERLGEICEELAARQEKVLVFTQFREIIPALEEFLSTIFLRKGLVLHGGTSIQERQELVESFQREDGPPFFILSLKAGGTGLTLTAASHVIHFDRWWNPAVENQATDRAFRIGQKKNVQVHKFITQGTLEEKIDAIIHSKKHLASEILSAEEDIRITEMPDDELLSLLSINIERATAN